MEDLERSSDIYTFVALMVIIYSSFINYPIVSFQYIIASSLLDKMRLYSGLLYQTKFFSTYLTKVILINSVYHHRSFFDFEKRTSYQRSS